MESKESDLSSLSKLAAMAMAAAHSANRLLTIALRRSVTLLRIKRGMKFVSNERQILISEI